MNPRSPEFKPAAGKPWEPLDVRRLCRPQHADAVVAQIAFVVKGARITVIARRMQFGKNAQPRAISQSRQDKYGDGRLARPAPSIRSIKARREPALSLPRGRPSLHWLGILDFLIDRQPHPNPHRPAFPRASDLLCLHVNGLTNRFRPRRPCIALPDHAPREYYGTAIRQGENTWGALLRLVQGLTSNLNQKSTQKKPRSQRECLGQPGAHSGPQAKGKCQRRPEQRLSRRIPAACHGFDLQGRKGLPADGRNSARTRNNWSEVEAGRAGLWRMRSRRQSLLHHPSSRRNSREVKSGQRASSITDSM